MMIMIKITYPVKVKLFDTVLQKVFFQSFNLKKFINI